MIKTPLSTVIGGAFWTPGATILRSSSQNLTQLIKSLFSLGEQGFAYDPNDLTTLYQDAAGTIPVTAGTIPVTAAGQPVGLMKDKSGRNNHAYQTTSAARPLLQYGTILGTNLVTNGDFSNGGTGWVTMGTPIFTFDTGRAYYNGTGGTGTGKLYNDAGMTVGKTYKIGFDYEVIQGLFMAGGTQSDTIGGRNITGKGRRQFNLTVTNVRDNGVYFRPENTSIACEFYIDNVTVQEIIGYNTNTKKVGYDSIDDKLITNLPTQLTSCTVIRSVPNVGTQILTGQTIPATFKDNKDHCGLIVINRALTPSETSVITAEFNKRAGV